MSSRVSTDKQKQREPTEMSMTLEIVANRIAELEKQMTAVLAKLEEKAEKEEKPKKEKADGEPKKKRGLTGYLLFAKEKRPEVKEELGEAKPTEVVTEVAKRWKALTEEERATWNERAKEGEEVEVEVA